MTRILVTGGTGFIGSHLVRSLAGSGQHDVTVLSTWEPTPGQLAGGANYIVSSLDDPALLEQAVREHEVEIVYHLAWNSIHETSLANTAADLRTNLLGTVNLLEACRKGGVRRMIFISSGGTVYGLPEKLPVTESCATRPICAYGVTKLAAEKYLGLYRHLYGLETVILRPSVPYGPGQNPCRRQGAVSVFIDRALRSEPVTIWGDGTSRRDYFFVADMIGPLIRAMSIPDSGQNVFNLGGRKAFTLNELVRRIEETLDLELRVDFEPARDFDVPELELDSRRAAATIGWRPQTELREGILSTAQWLRQRGD